jgi:hypothetical protein
VTRDDVRLFDEVLRQALGGDTWDALMQKHAVALQRGDFERVRALNDIERLAVVLGNHALLTEWMKPNRA